MLALWTEVTKRKQGERTDLLDNVQEVTKAPTGNTAAAGLRKLQKAASEGNEKAEAELAAAVEGKKSVNRACVDARAQIITPELTFSTFWRIYLRTGGAKKEH